MRVGVAIYFILFRGSLRIYEDFPLEVGWRGWCSVDNWCMGLRSRFLVGAGELDGREGEEGVLPVILNFM